MNFFGQDRWRRTQACVSLLAVVFLYAPLVATAWSANASCCNSKQCPISSHHHKKVPAQQPEGMNCEHGSQMPGATACSMSCCQTTEGQMLIPANFVPPPIFLLQEPGVLLLAAAPERSAEPWNSHQPISPPPRSSRTAV
jgi:hypothetical protein